MGPRWTGCKALTISYPAVPVSQQRLRISMMATFSDAELEQAAKTIGKVMREMKAIPS